MNNYKYTLPEDDEEVIVSGIAMAILDVIKQKQRMTSSEIEAHARYHCEMARQRIQGCILTNDYQTFTRLFVENYIVAYQNGTQKMDSDTLVAIVNRYDILTALASIRNIVKMLYFPDSADLTRLVMQYQDVIITPRRDASGYYATFVYHNAVQRTPNKATPKEALGAAEAMIDAFKAH